MFLDFELVNVTRVDSITALLVQEPQIVKTVTNNVAGQKLEMLVTALVQR